MERWAWQTTPDGFVEVDKADGQGFVRIELGPDTNTEQTTQWIKLASEKAKKYGVPIPWILGIIYSESGGNPTAENWCCAGLMAIFYSQHGMTRQEALDPETNLDYGTKLLSLSVEKGLDLPKAASVHNAGGGTTGLPHPSLASPWGMRENSGEPYGYIERVVRAQNYFRRILPTIMVSAEQPRLEDPIHSTINLGTLTPFVAATLLGYISMAFVGKKILRRLKRKWG